MKPENNYRELVIIVAEDDMGHAELIKEGLRDSGICNSILHFLNGEEVWNFLSDEENSLHRDVSNSYLLLLDINMPRMDGIEVLRRLKENDSLKDIPVVMLTTTDDPGRWNNVINWVVISILPNQSIFPVFPKHFGAWDCLFR
jgi:CheY-like chemotaxis protein